MVMKIRAAKMSRDPFLVIDVDLDEFRRSTLMDWSFFTKKKNITIRHNSSRLVIGNELAYPKVFIVQFKNAVIAGYAEPNIVKRISGFYRKYKCDLASYVKEIDKNEYHEYLLISLDFDSNNISVRRDAWCTIPIFYGRKNTRFILSNEFSYVAEIVCKDDISISGQCIAESLLSLDEDDRTILADVHLLPERSLLLQNQKQKARIVRPKSIDKPRQLTGLSEKEMRDGLHQHLKSTLRSMQKRVGQSANLGFELSGGLDTSAVVGTCASLDMGQIKTYSLVLPGDQGKSQNAKKVEMVSTFNIRNKTVSARQFYPLKSIVESKKLPVRYPSSEIYAEMVDHQARVMKKDNIDVAVTGFGGDELFLLDPREDVGFGGKQERQYRKNIKMPAYYTDLFRQLLISNLPSSKLGIIPPVPYSVLSSHVARNNIYVRRGVWPLAPLSTPNLVAYCRSLPYKWREGKKIMREYQKHLGYPSGVYTPEENENFAQLFDATMRTKWRDLFMKLLRGSILSKLGIVKSDVLIKEYRDFIKGKSQIKPFKLFVVIEQEILLNALASL